MLIRNKIKKDEMFEAHEEELKEKAKKDKAKAKPGGKV